MAGVGHCPSHQLSLNLHSASPAPSFPQLSEQLLKGLAGLHPLAAVEIHLEGGSKSLELWLLMSEGNSSKIRREKVQWVDFYLWCIVNYLLGKEVY